MESNIPSNLPSLINAFLFSEGGSLTLRKLSHLTGVNEPHIKGSLEILKTQLAGTGLTIVQTDTEASLVIDQTVSPAIQAALQREFSADIGDAGLEVLAIVLYRGASTRAQIDYIRGVNTSSTIRGLLARGLLERTGNPDDGREFLYRPTVELLTHLGIRSVSELPDRDNVVRELNAFEAASSVANAQEGLGNPDPESTQKYGDR